uniref:Protein FAR1-RELATED SEQUENCE n=1 Tax=Cajanus cajan TaxID=3821 RepID=A0A151R6I6_CAJCA|nr:Protein FAR1-RELATED SEQUENCE 5 [Cajanus cajan]
MQMKSGVTGGVLKYLQKMQLEDSNFFYAIHVNEDDLITNIFLDDVKMMIDYSYFGDVVCFDTTYNFALKEKWTLVYSRENFCVDMTTTQRNESMNNTRYHVGMIVVCIFPLKMGEVIEYKVTSYKKLFQHTIHYDFSVGLVKCSCKRYEFVGILCSHALKVLFSRNVMKIPTMYVLKRWEMAYQLTIL